MIVKSLFLEGFRNYDKIFVEFEDNVNVITGNNAQGKTNLLESIYYMTSAKSFRTRSDSELIGFNLERATIEVDITSSGREQKLKSELMLGRRRKIYANGVKLKTSAELSGRLTAVLFSPDDLYLIRDGAAVRRKLMDFVLCQLRPRYAAALAEFNRVYEHKTRILRDWHEKPSLLEALDEYSYRLAQMSAELIYYRAAFSKVLSEKAAKIHSEFSGGAEDLKIEYRTIKTIDDTAKKPAELLPMILEHLESHRAAELESSLCLSGAHKDDLEIMIDGVSAKNFASQGQTRTAALSVKLAEREIHFDDRGEYPILLLDDVLSELDHGRQDFVLNRIKDGQIFITCCEGKSIAEKTGGRVFFVENGKIARS